MYKRFLREEGYDVLDAKNAQSFDYLHTKIIYHSDNIEMAQYISKLLGVNDSLLINSPNPDLIFDLSILIGRDFNELSSFDEVSLYYPIY